MSHSFLHAQNCVPCHRTLCRSTMNRSNRLNPLSIYSKQRPKRTCLRHRNQSQTLTYSSTTTWRTRRSKILSPTTPTTSAWPAGTSWPPTLSYRGGNGVHVRPVCTTNSANSLELLFDTFFELITRGKNVHLKIDFFPLRTFSVSAPSLPTAQKVCYFQTPNRPLIDRAETPVWASNCDSEFSQISPTPVIFVSFSRHF